MRTLGLTALLLASVAGAFGQPTAPIPEKAPPDVDAALRARVAKFYDAIIAGKFKEAYVLVADDSQDRFFEMDKGDYKSCAVDVVDYSDRVTKALVITKCKGDWRLQGRVFPVTFPIRSNWALIDGQWYWRYVKPSMVQSPFSKSGWVPVPAESKDGTAPIVPKDFAAVAQGILSQVSVDKTSVRFGANQASREVVRVRNDMPGEISLDIKDPGVPGLKVSAETTKLQAHQTTEVVLAWNPVNAPAAPPNSTVELHVAPTNQIFPIAVSFEDGPTVAPAQK